jgi:hypothetical protein
MIHQHPRKRAFNRKLHMDSKKISTNQESNIMKKKVDERKIKQRITTSLL